MVGAMSAVWVSRKGATIFIASYVLACFILSTELLYFPRHVDSVQIWSQDTATADAVLRKPANTTVSGLVFYGRKDRVSCLRCYIEVS